jgi:archaellum biogenesis protein FlaJ (TadC family)
MKTETKYAITYYLSIASTTAFIIYVVLVIIYGKVLGIGVGLGLLTAIIIECQIVFILYLYMKKNKIMANKPEVNDNEEYNN